jgi:hypothetical protein
MEYLIALGAAAMTVAFAFSVVSSLPSYGR